jgi:DNA-binding response OmpR family regulator
MSNGRRIASAINRRNLFMSTNASAPSLARPTSALTGTIESVFPDRDSQPAIPSTASLDLRPDQYRVALVPMGTHRLRDKSATSDATMPDVLLLPLTWDDLLGRLHSHATYPRSQSRGDMTQFGDVRIDFLTHETWRADQAMVLTAFEFKVLKFFVANPYRVISRQELLDTVWGYHSYPTTRTVDNQILHLRQKLEPEPANPVHFQTVYGVGYKFVP